MELHEIWLEKEEYERRFDYLLYAFDSIEAEVFKSFDINPLRKENLKVTSMFYADVSIRLYPLLTIGFNLLTFGFGMQHNVTILRQISEDEKLNSEINVEKIESSLVKLKGKNIQNKDTLRDYYKLYDKGELGISKIAELMGWEFQEAYDFIKKNTKLQIL